MLRCRPKTYPRFSSVWKALNPHRFKADSAIGGGLVGGRSLGPDLEGSVLILGSSLQSLFPRIT